MLSALFLFLWLVAFPLEGYFLIVPTLSLIATVFGSLFQASVSILQVMSFRARPTDKGASRTASQLSQQNAGNSQSGTNSTNS